MLPTQRRLCVYFYENTVDCTSVLSLFLLMKTSSATNCTPWQSGTEHYTAPDLNAHLLPPNAEKQQQAQKRGKKKPPKVNSFKLRTQLIVLRLQAINRWIESSWGWHFEDLVFRRGTVCNIYASHLSLPPDPWVLPDVAVTQSAVDANEQLRCRLPVPRWYHE